MTSGLKLYEAINSSAFRNIVYSEKEDFSFCVFNDGTFSDRLIKPPELKKHFDLVQKSLLKLPKSINPHKLTSKEVSKWSMYGHHRFYVETCARAHNDKQWCGFVDVSYKPDYKWLKLGFLRVLKTTVNLYDQIFLPAITKADAVLLNCISPRYYLKITRLVRRKGSCYISVLRQTRKLDDRVVLDIASYTDKNVLFPKNFPDRLKRIVNENYQRALLVLHPNGVLEPKEKLEEILENCQPLRPHDNANIL